MRLPLSCSERFGCCSAKDCRSSRPLRLASPAANSRFSNCCSVSVRFTLAEKPAVFSLRIAGSTEPASQFARPEGWLEASSRSPRKLRCPLRFSRPFASSCVRPGKSATTLSITQPAPSGWTSMRTSRTVVSPTTIAGSFRLARPGTCGMGISAAIASIASSRWRMEIAGSRPVLALRLGPMRLTSICWPSAISRNFWSLPVSSVASPVTT
ncbi:hypothetical protein D9M72_343830 [compost metagenome]